jgi:putative PIN family toxin of toxin-antitoxin system
MKHYAVIDTNVLVSAFLKWDSVPGFVLQAVFDGRIVPVLNEEILEEYRVVLNRPKFGFSPVRIAETLLQINRLCVMESDLVEFANRCRTQRTLFFMQSR